MIYNKVFGKIGELVQGKLGPDQPFLLTNHTSTRFNTITVMEKHSYPKMRLREKTLDALVNFLLFKEGVPLNEIAGCSKADKEQAFKEKTETYLKGFRITQTSNIPKGKGLSSSSTDLLGLLDLLNIYFKTNYSVDTLYQLAALVEPTDPCFSSTGVLLNQCTGKVEKELALLPFDLIYFDSDKNKMVDTISYCSNQSYQEQDYKDYKTMLNDIPESVKQKDYTAFFDIFTKSAAMNEVRLPKVKFSILQSFAADNRCGVFAAHSGTIMGLLVEPSKFNEIHKNAGNLIQQEWKAEVYIEKA